MAAFNEERAGATVVCRFILWTSRAGIVYYRGMQKVSAILLVLFVLAVTSFGTWQMFRGNLEAAYSCFPFLVIVYLFVKSRRR